MAQHQAAVANNSNKSSRADDHSPDAKQANKVNARANADVMVDAHTMLLIQNNKHNNNRNNITCDKNSVASLSI